MISEEKRDRGEANPARKRVVLLLWRIALHLPPLLGFKVLQKNDVS